MKAMILAAEVIEMMQEISLQDRMRRLPAQVIREEQCIASAMAAPFTPAP